MRDDPDDLVAGLRELAEREVPPPGERFEAGLRQTVRGEQRRRRTQRRRLAAAGALIVVLAALAVALALPVTARFLPLPVGHELRRLDAQTSDLQAQLGAQPVAQAQLRRQLAARTVFDQALLRRLVARLRAAMRRQAGAAAPRSTPYEWVVVSAAASPSPGAGSSTVTPLATASRSPAPSPSPAPTQTLTPAPTPTPTPTAP